ncbi:MAG: hypothetical protein KF809_15805 [Chloroflexi bacterium]|nr:hypothetical protein [Chloroflexota bacterium]
MSVLLLGTTPQSVLAASPEPGASVTSAEERTPVGVARDDHFELTISTERERFDVDEPIPITTAIRYTGSEDRFDIGTSYGGIIAFRIEQLDGPIDLGPARRAACISDTFVAGEVRDVPFSPSGGFDMDDPLADMLRTILTEPELRLPMGTYRITAQAEYGLQGCAGSRHLEASITIAVGQVPEVDPAGAAGAGGQGLVPEPVEVLDCDGAPSTIGADLSPGELDVSGPDPAAVLRASMRDTVYLAPRTGYEALAADAHRMLFVYRVAGRVKVAVLLRDDVEPSASTWQVTGYRSCELEELGPDVDLGPDWRVWAHPDGRILVSRRNSSHCGWERVWSLLYQRDPLVEYLRDPEQHFRDVVPVPYATGVRLPRQASDTGYRRGEAQLWAVPNGRALYIVRDDGVVERWSRLDGGVVCN